MQFFENDFYGILPELFLLLSSLSLLMFGVVYSTSKEHGSPSLMKVMSWASVLCLVLTGFLLLNTPCNSMIFFSQSLLLDELSVFFKILILVGSVSSILMSFQYFETERMQNFEYLILILLSTLSMFLLVSSYDLISMYLAIEMQSLCFYVLAASQRNSEFSTEAGLKYFLLGAFSSGVFLLGCSFLYGITGLTNFESYALFFSQESQIQQTTEWVFVQIALIFILLGFFFKLSAAPFHFWAPDVYEGSPTSVTLFFTMVPKIAALTIFIRFLYVPFLNLIDQWQMIIIFLSIASMLFGAIAAIGQTNIKRLIAYSSIGHIGYTLAGLATGSNEGIQSSIIYITIYVIMNLAFFSCLLMLKRNDQYYEDIDDLSGLSKNHPLLSLSLLVILFSLAGIPPLAGFFAKFYIFTAVLEQSMYFLAIVGLLSTVIAAFYYLRIIKIIYFDKEKEKYDSDHSLWLKFSLTFSTILILLYFIFPSQLIEVVSRINII